MVGGLEEHLQERIQSSCLYYPVFDRSSWTKMNQFLADIKEWPPILTGTMVALFGIWVAVLARARAMRGRLPPGPRGWPLVGSLFQLGSRPHVSWQEMAKQYGPIFHMKLGLVRVVVVSSPEMAKEVLKTHDQVLCSRPKTPNAYHAAWDKLDMAWAPAGRYWRDMRKLCSTELLTERRLQNDDFQKLRKSEIEYMIRGVLNESQQSGGKPLDISRYFTRLSFNNISQMVLGRRFYNMDGSQVSGSNDPGNQMFAELFYLLGEPNISDFIPFLTVFDLHGLQKRGKILNSKIDKYIQSIIDEYLHASNEQQISGSDKHPNSKGTFVEQLFKLRAESRAPEDLDGPEDSLSIDSIKGLVMDMMAGGSDTSATVLEWTLSELMRHPHVMKKVQAELHSVVGRNRLVTEADIPNLKYLQAVIKETLRLHPSVPIMAPHYSTKECYIAGYRIPADTQVFVNVYSIHRDPSVWDRPLEYDPERFVDSKIGLLGLHYELLPFGSGRRMCPGYNLGLIMVHYPLAQVLHAFNCELPEGQKPEDVDIAGEGGSLHRKAVPLHIILKPRLNPDVYETPAGTH